MFPNFSPLYRTITEIGGNHIGLQTGSRGSSTGLPAGWRPPNTYLMRGRKQLVTRARQARSPPLLPNKNYTLYHRSVNERPEHYVDNFHLKARKAVSNLWQFVWTDISRITPKFREIVLPFHHQEICIPSAAIRWHDFGNRPALGRPFGHFSRHPDTPLLSLSPRRRFPRPTPERVFVVDHRSGSGFSGTVPSEPPPRPVGR